MELLDQFGNPFPTIQNSGLATPDQWFIDWVRGDGGSSSGMAVNNTSAMRVATVFACVRNICNDIGKLPWITYRRLKKGKERADDLPLYWLLHDSPNPEMSSFTFRQTLTKDLLLGGNGYAEIQFKRRIAAALWPLEQTCVTVKRRTTGELFYVYADPANGYEERELEESQVFHLRGIGDGLVGYSVIKLARETFGIALAQDKYNGSSMGNDSTPGGVLSVKGSLSDQARKRLREEWEDLHRGADKRRRIAVATESDGLTFTPVEISPEDAQFVMRLQHTIEEICRWFRMPPHKAGHLLRSTNNNIEQQALEYVQDCLRDWAEIWEQEVSRKLIPPTLKREIFAEFDFRDALRTDHVSRAEYFNTLFQIGAINDNEIRELENMNPYDGGDTYFANAALVPVQILAKGPQNDTQPEQDSAKTDEKPSKQDQNEQEPDTTKQNSRIHSILAAHEPLIADILRNIHKTEQDKISRASKRSNFAEFATKFYATQPQFVSDTVQPAVIALSTSLAAILNVDLPQRSILDEIVAAGHRIVWRSKQEMKDGEAVKGWSNGRADQEAKDICSGIVRAMNITLTEEHETGSISSQ